MTITEFVLARIAEDEAVAVQQQRINGAHYSLRQTWQSGTELGGLLGVDPARVLAQCAAMRKIVQLHQSWPVLVQTPPEISLDDGLSTMTMRMTQQIAWTTEQEYRHRFGDEPPTAPMIAALASIWSDHPDFDPAWLS